MSQNRGFYEAAKYLGEHKRISQGMLRKTACMGQEQREEIAILDSIKDILPFIDSPGFDDADLSTLIDKAVMPVLKNLGYALWQRDVVTDMAIKKGDTSLSETYRRKREGEE